MPLRRRDRFSAVNLPVNLTPVFEIDGMECLLETPNLAAVPLRILKTPIASLVSRQCEITAALDFLFQGF
ncbi:MAG: CcdB family protein [Methylobacter sp.]